MSTLKELLGTDKRSVVIADSLRVLDAEVADKGGLGGMAVKTAYKIVKGVSPDFLEKVVDVLFDDFMDALDPIYQEAVSAGTSPRAQLVQNTNRVADALLSITDRRAQTAKNAVVKKSYEKLRGSAKKHVEAAVPRLGELLERHVGS
ncbi:MAG: hypothetical protein OXU20_35375 [Myxococcales bacterium]|nr:hypothetical protein [Myxococcales bacterium]MDD9971957.1 hypothetical protein [Myxococcales bacterium]